MLPRRIAKASRPTWAGSADAAAAERIARPLPTPDELNVTASHPAIVTAPTRRRAAVKAAKPAKARKPAAGPAGFIAACKAAGATVFCAPCYAYVLPGHQHDPEAWALLHWGPCPCSMRARGNEVSEDTLACPPRQHERWQIALSMEAMADAARAHCAGLTEDGGPCRTLGWSERHSNGGSVLKHVAPCPLAAPEHEECEHGIDMARDCPRCPRVHPPAAPDSERLAEVES